MNFEINKEDWAMFFDSLSKRRYEWITRIEVINGEIGDQVLSDGMPLNGVTVETRGDRTNIDISVGMEDHQTHNILNPTRVSFLAADDVHGDIVDIEEEDGTKTLITFMEPMGVLVGIREESIIAVAA
jgi:hypothetical protein